MTFLPGKQDVDLGGIHRRDLETDVRRLRGEYHVDTFVLLVEDHELQMLGVPTLADVMAAHGIELIRHSIVDTRVPDDPTTLRQSLDLIRVRLAAGRTVAIACRGGVGRTGTVVGCLLRDGGLDAKAAIALTRASRHGTIENDDQERFVENWGEQ